MTAVPAVVPDGVTVTALRFHNPRIQRLRRLIGRRSARTEEGILVVEGPKSLTEALDGGAQIECVFLESSSAAHREGAFDEILRRVASLGIEIVEVESGVFERVLDVGSPQALCATVVSKKYGLEALTEALGNGGFLVVGVGIRDPGNAGTMIRSAESSGAAGVVFCNGSVDAANPKVVRSTAGALFHLPVVVGVALPDVLAFLRQVGAKSWAATVRPGEAVAYYEADFRGPSAVLFGNEARGLSSEELSDVDALLTIPMYGRTESLNVSMSVAVICFEAARQRTMENRWRTGNA